MKNITLKNKPVILKNTDFQTIIVQVLFPYKKEKKDLAHISLLPALLNYMNNKYQNEADFVLERKKLLILNTSVTRTSIGENGYFSFNLVVPDTFALGKDLLDEQFSFFKEIIYNPRIENEAFLEFDVNKEINNIKRSIDNSLKNMMPYHSYKLKKLIDDEGMFSESLIDNQNLLDKVTPESLYNFYLKVIKNSQPIIYVFGNVVEEQIRNLCTKYLYIKDFDTNTIEFKFDYFLKPRNQILEIEEDSTFKDSAISYIYKVKDMNEEDTVYLNIIRDLLNSLSSRLLGKKLRDENDLIYSSKVVSYDRFGVFEITALINKENIDLVKMKILEVMKDLKNEKIITPLLENIKERKRLNLLRMLDDKYSLLGDFIVEDLGFDDTNLEFYNKVKNVTANDISNFIDRMVLDTIYFLKEEEHE